MSERKRVSARDVMTQDYALVNGQATVAEALAGVGDDGVAAFVVDKRDADDEYGIVLLSDIAKKVLAQDRAPERVNVYEIMAKPVLSVEANMDVRYCARLFERFGLPLAPVMEQGTLVGVISYRDMVLKGMLSP